MLFCDTINYDYGYFQNEYEGNDKQMNAAYVYLQLYRLFDKATPIFADCGKLCNKACCEGDDCGMYLFPGEQKVYELLDPEWSEIESSDFTYTHEGKTKKVPIIFCNGNCDRFQRPLACRIFPLTPILNENKELKIIVDPRAKSICPLSRNLKLSDYNPEFVKNVKKAFSVLLTNKEFYSFMTAYSEYISEYLKFFN